MDLHPGNILVRYSPCLQSKTFFTKLRGHLLYGYEWLRTRSSRRHLQLVFLDAGLATSLTESDLGNLQALCRFIIDVATE